MPRVSLSEDDGWFAVALSADLEPGMAIGTRLHGVELVAWRDQSGEAHVWPDRCPHRGMRLSFGFVRGDRLACLYHGWQFDGAGQCRFIPAHPALAVPPTIHAATSDCVERHGMVWTRRTGADIKQPEWSAPLEATPVRSIAIARDASLIRAALPGQPAPADTIAAIQPLATGRSMLHLTVAGAPDRASLLAVCDWAETFRDAVEAGD